MSLSPHIVTKVVAAAGLAVVLGTTALAGAVQANDGQSGWRGGDRHAGQMRHSGRHSEGGHARIEQFDANKDGTVTQIEIDQVRTDRFAIFDANKDGKLSLQEFEPLWLEFTRQQMVRSFQHLDPDGDAVVTKDEYLAPTRNMVTRADRNGDGQLSQQDMRHHRGKGAAPLAVPNRGAN